MVSSIIIIRKTACETVMMLAWTNENIIVLQWLECRTSITEVMDVLPTRNRFSYSLIPVVINHDCKD